MSDSSTANRIARDYRFQGHEGAIDETEEVRCESCGAVETTPGTLSYLWHARRSDVRPPIIELCRWCHARTLMASETSESDT